MSKVKLPKQWRHWCADSRLNRAYRKSSRRSNDFYLVGRGHVWRVNCHGEFERGDTRADFDRWALCEIFSSPLPQTREEFRAFVTAALAAHKP